MRISRLSSFLFIGCAFSLVVAACGGGAQATPTAAVTAAPTGGVNATVAPTPTNRPAATVAPVPTATPVAVPTGQFRFAMEIFSTYSLLPGLSLSRSYLDAMFDVMAGEGATGDLDPTTGVTTAWQANSDATSWTVKMRPGILFHNGDTATAKDLKYSLDYYNHSGTNTSGSGYATRQPPVASIQAPDEATVTIAFKAPSIFFPFQYLAIDSQGTSASYLLPKAYMEAKGADVAATKLDFSFLSKNPIGSGPYKFKNDVVNQEVDMEAWERPHWLYGVPRYRVAQVVAIPDPSTRTALLKSGGLEAAQIARSFSPDLKKAGFDIVQAAGSRYGYISVQEQYKTSYGSAKNPLADVRVREALSITIDRELIVQQFLLTLGAPTVSSRLPPAIGFKPYPVPKRDLTKAKNLLTQAGYPTGFTLTVYLFITPGLPDAIEIMEAIAVWWEELGLKIERRSIDSSASYIPVVSKGFSAPTVGGIWWANVPRIVAGNLAGIKTNIIKVTEDDQIDQATKDLAGVTSRDDYIAKAQKLEDLNVQRWIAMPLFGNNNLFAVKQGLGGPTWNTGLGGNGTSVNLMQLLSGKNIVR